MTDNVVDGREGGLTLILKNIPPDQVSVVEEALEKLMHDLNLEGTFWSQTVQVIRKRKHRRVLKGTGKKPGIEGYVSETY